MNRDENRFYTDTDEEMSEDMSGDMSDDMSSRDPREDDDNAIHFSDEGNGDLDHIQYFSRLLSALRKSILSAKNVPLSDKKVVDADRILDILDSLEENLPDAIQYGQQMYIERDRLLGESRQDVEDLLTSAERRAKGAVSDAREEAERIITEAHAQENEILNDATERARAMVEESEVLRLAEEKARKISIQARSDAQRVREQARREARELLTGVQQELGEMLKAVRGQLNDIPDDNEP